MAGRTARPVFRGGRRGPARRVTQATCTLSGGGWDHVTRIQATAATTPISDIATYYYYLADERLTLTYDEELLVSAGRLYGDLSGTPLAAVAYIPPVFTNFSGASSVEGGRPRWRSAGSAQASSARL